jgi:hypothetical protein
MRLSSGDNPFCRVPGRFGGGVLPPPPHQLLAALSARNQPRMGAWGRGAYTYSRQCKYCPMFVCRLFQCFLVSPPVAVLPARG